MGQNLLTKQNFTRFVLLFSLLSVLLSFQNCGSQFEVQQLSADLASLSVSKIPRIEISSAPDLINTLQYDLEFTINDVDASELKSVTCQLGQNPAVDCMTKKASFNQLADGDYQIKIAAETKSGMKAELTKLFRKDSTGPTITVLSKPNALTNQTTANVSISTQDNLSGVDHTECAFDTATFTACTGPFAFNNLIAGNHALMIKAFDKAGNVSLIANVAWVVDLAVPVITFSQTPLEATNQTTANFAFNGAGVVSYECQLDAQAFTACTSPKALTALTAGAHTFKVRGTSAAGNISLPVAFTWTVDLTVPVIAFSQMPAAVTNQTTGNFAFAGAGVVSFECQLDAQAFAPCVSPKSYAGLAAGNHTLKVRGKNAVGTDSNTLNYSWSIDLTAPTVIFSQMPAVNSNQSTATFAFSGAGIVTYECQLDAQAFAACTSPKVVSGLTAGSHTFKVRGTNGIGNVSNPITFNWTVELQASAIVISQMPPALTSSTTAAFAFSGNNLASYQCQLDAAAFVTCTSPQTYTNLSSAAHTFKVKGTSLAGNLATEVTFNWTVDAVVPTVTISATPSSLTSSTSATFVFAGTNAVSFECQKDGAAFATCASPVNMAGLASGNHTFAVRAVSASGLQSSVASFIWTVDLVPPTLPTLAASTGAVTNQTTTQFTFASTDANGINRYECSINGAALTTCSSPTTVTSKFGSNTFDVRAVDNAGNASAFKSFSWTMDNVAPSTPLLIHNLMYATTKVTTFTATYSSTDSGVGGIVYRCVIDGAVTDPCPSINLPAVADGPHTVLVFATDAAGNQSAPGSHSWVVDTVAPVINFGVVPPATQFISTTANLTFTFSVTEANSGISYTTCKFDGAAAVACDSSFAVNGVFAGNHTLLVTSGDVAGNVGTKSYSFDLVMSALVCAPNSMADCAANNGTGKKTCAADGSAYGACVLNACNSGFMLSGQVCVAAVPTDLTTFDENIVMTDRFACAITPESKVKCWGHTSSLAADFSTFPVPTFVHPGNNIVNAKSLHRWGDAVLVRLTDLTYRILDYNYFSFGTVNVLSTPGINQADIVQISARTSNTNRKCALLKNGTVYCWEPTGIDLNNKNPSIMSFNGNPAAPFTDIKAILSNGSRICFLRTDGDVVCDKGIFDGTSTPFVNYAFASIGNLGGTIAHFGSQNDAFTHACAVLTNGQVKCWGDYNNYGQMGNGFAQSPRPFAQIDTAIGITSAIQVKTAMTSCVLERTGKVKCMGKWMYYGFTIMDALGAPQEVPGLTDAKAITVSSAGGCAITTQNKVKCWGNNKDGILGNNTTVSSTSAVDAIGLDVRP